MPVTPLHIGIPGIPAYFKPERVDIVAAVLGSTLIDIDFFRHVMYGTPIHGSLHSYPGATILAGVLSFLLMIMAPITKRVKIWFRWPTETSFRSIATGAFLGAYSHVFLDSLIYYDVEPWYPDAGGNPFYHHQWVDQMTAGVYAVAGLTTLLLIILWITHYMRTSGRDQE